MKVAQRIISLAAVATVAACANTGGLGNVLGGVLGNQPMQVGATVQGVDTRNQIISMTQSNGQSLGVNYDSRTRVVYQNQLYPVTSLEYGDQIVARLQDNGNNNYYADSIFVTQPVNGSVTSQRGVYNGGVNNGGVYNGGVNNGGSNSANVQTLQGTVRQIDRNGGWFVIDGGNGVQLTVSLPYRANSQDVNRFNNLRTGDYVRFYGVYLNNNRVELRQFY